MAEPVKLQLDVTSFNGAAFQSCLERCKQSGLRFSTVAEADAGPVANRMLYELNKTCSADIPDRGAFYTFEEYVAQRINVPFYDPRGVVLAIDHGTWVGMAATSVYPDRGYALSEMTGVLRSYRGQGVSIAMKVLAIEYVRDRGLRWIRTGNGSANAPAIAMNRRLGFVDEDPQLWAAQPSA